MATFDDREKGFEHKFKHDKELDFKVNARRRSPSAFARLRSAFSFFELEYSDST